MQLRLDLKHDPKFSRNNNYSGTDDLVDTDDVDNQDVNDVNVSTNLFSDVNDEVVNLNTPATKRHKVTQDSSGTTTQFYGKKN